MSDGLAPWASPRVIAEEGACKLLGPKDLFCSAACAAGTTCAGNDQCAPSPAKRSVGNIEVGGALQAITAKSNPITLAYSSTIFEPFPGFETGSLITVTAEGGELSPFTLNATGVSPLSSDATKVAVTPGEPVTLTWGATAADRLQNDVAITFTVNAHGVLTGWIECETEDSGSFELPAQLVKQLIDLGLSGFPRASIARRTTDTAPLPGGCVDLSVSSEITIELEIDGLTSCQKNEDCPAAQSCSAELACE